MLTQPQREELRAAVREVLVTASTVALPADVIARRITRQKLTPFTPELAEVESAVEFIVGLGHASAIPHSLGATKHYQATAAGVLAHERGI